MKLEKKLWFIEHWNSLIKFYYVSLLRNKQTSKWILLNKAKNDRISKKFENIKQKSQFFVMFILKKRPWKNVSTNLSLNAFVVESLLFLSHPVLDFRVVRGTTNIRIEVMILLMSMWTIPHLSASHLIKIAFILLKLGVIEP